MAMVCPPAVELAYLHLWFKSIDLWELNSGTSVPQINNKDIDPLLLPIPPKAEQKRIVSKVSVLLSQLDELSARLRSRQSTTDALLTALIHQILNPDDSREAAKTAKKNK